MPPFPERESALLTRLHGKSEGNHDKRTWVIGGKSDNQERQASRYRSFTQSSASGPPAAALGHVNGNGQRSESKHTEEETEEPEQVENLMGADDDVAVSSDIMSSLAGLNIGDPATALQAPLLGANNEIQSPLERTDIAIAPTAEPIPTSAALAAMSLTKGHGIEKVGNITLLAPGRELMAILLNSGLSDLSTTMKACCMKTNKCRLDSRPSIMAISAV